jgi:hypothetical protein
MTAVTTAEIRKIFNQELTDAVRSSNNLKITPYNGRISYKAVEFIDDFELYAKTKSWRDRNKSRSDRLNYLNLI